ncbi:MAG: M23 family metallopeptidase [Myxococcota bacterium]
MLNPASLETPTDPDPTDGLVGDDPLSLPLPFRGEDLRDDEVLATRIHAGGGLAHDFSGWRWYPGTTAWFNRPVNHLGSTDPNHFIAQGLPVYAAADGEIVACWRMFPDNPDTDVDQLDDNLHRMVGGGNQVYIRTADDQFIFYGHLKSMSIPQSLCPLSSPDGWLQHTPLHISLQFEDEMLVEPPIPVHEGQLIGRVGNTGTAQPHLHIHAGPLAEDEFGNIARVRASPIEFTGGVTGDWSPAQHQVDIASIEWQSLDDDRINPRIDAAGGDMLAILPD